MSKKHYLETEIGAGRASLDDLVQIDQYAPKGLYWNAKGECILVCDDPQNRFMVILSHEEYDPFTAINLGEIPFGKWSCRPQFVWQFPGMFDEAEGQLDLGEAQLLETTVNLVTQDLKGSQVMKAVSHGCGTLHDNWHNYQSWQLLAGGEVVFSKGGPLT